MTIQNGKLRFAVLAGLSVAALFMIGMPQDEAGSFAQRMPAEDDPYTFGSGCGSQGAWTQEALQNLNGLYSIISSLKDNPKCKGKESTINGIVANFQQAESALKGGSGGVDSNTIESLPGEIDALQRVAGGSGGSRGLINALLGKKVFKAAAMSTKKAAEEPEPGELIDPTTAVKALYRRTNRAAGVGLDLVNRIFTAIPSLDECIMGQPNVGLSLIGAAVQVGAAFGSSGGGTGHKIGASLGALATMLRDRKFTLAMRQIDERKFWTSVSCLLETTTKNFCDAQNAQEMLAYAMKEYQRTMKNVRAGMADPQSDNPLEGYYLLSRELPTISNWLSQVKLGSEPRTTADSTLQKEAIEKVNEYWKMKKDVAGLLSLRIRDIMALPELSARQYGMYQLVGELHLALTRNIAAATFVFQAQREAYLPFYLIGLADIPEALRPNVQNARVIPWGDWMESGGDGGKLQPMFSDPVALMKTVVDQTERLLRAADTNAAAFFRQRLVVDLENLVSLTTSGQNTTVYQSFVHVIRYLERFEKRLAHSGSDVDLAMLGTVRETQERVRKILKSYQKIMAIGRDYKSGKIEIVAEDERLKEASREIIDMVFLQFNVLYQSDVFLTNRMTTFIQKDFSMRVKEGTGLSAHQRDLMFVAQDHLVQKLLQNFGQNQTDALNDLATAQTINLTNLRVFEEMFGDTLYAMLEELNEVAHGRPASPAALQHLASQRMQKDLVQEKKWAFKSGMMSGQARGDVPAGILQGIVNWFRAGIALKTRHPDLYERSMNPNRVSGGDTKFGDFARFRALVCSHTLAFEHRERFQPLCKDAILTSAYSTSADTLGNLDLQYDKYWPLDYAHNPRLLPEHARQIRAKPAVASKYICAYNNFWIRNWVRMLQDRDQREDDYRTEGEFEFERDERLAKEAQEKKEAETVAAQNGRLMPGTTVEGPGIPRIQSPERE